MAQPVYSLPFILWTPGAPNNAFQVPEQSVAVVRYITYWEGAGAGEAHIYLQNSSLAPGLTFAVLKAAGGDAYAVWDGHVSVVGGGIITLYLGYLGTDPNCYVGGYLLQQPRT